MATAEPVQRVSRLGKRPVAVPAGVTIEIDGPRTIKVKGPKGEMERTFHEDVTLKFENNEVTVHPANSSRHFAQFQGLTRALVNNMVQGVTEGYKKSLDLVGVGYRADLKGQHLTLALGLSHQVHHDLDPSIKASVEIIDEGGTKRPRLHLESYDKEALGRHAAKIRSYRPPEPYKGKGVRYTGEQIRTKAGKAGSK